MSNSGLHTVEQSGLLPHRLARDGNADEKWSLEISEMVTGAPGTVSTAAPLPLPVDKNKMAEVQLEGNYDDVQVQLMNEKCIVVNEKDEPIGTETKKNCTQLSRCVAATTHA